MGKGIKSIEAENKIKAFFNENSKDISFEINDLIALDLKISRTTLVRILERFVCLGYLSYKKKREPSTTKCSFLYSKLKNFEGKKNV